MTFSAFSFFLYGFLHKSLQLQLEKGEEYRNAMAAMEVDGTARAAADGNDLPGASASVGGGGGGGGNNSRRGRTADGGR